jgi:Formyl transferase
MTFYSNHGVQQSGLMSMVAFIFIGLSAGIIYTFSIGVRQRCRISICRLPSGRPFRIEALAGLISEREPRRIVLLHLDSLCCLPALEALFAGLGGRIGLAISSERFGGLQGFRHQLKRTLRRSGLPMTLTLGFDIVALRIAAVIAPTLRWPIRQSLRIFRGGQLSPLRTLKEHAERVGASYAIIQDINGPASLDLFRAFQPDLVISFHFDQILREPFFRTVTCPILNVHPALLPAHRGPCPSFWSLAAGDAHSGVTVHRIVDEAIDAGPILSARSRPLPHGVSMGELDELLFMDGVDALLPLLSANHATSLAADLSEPMAYEPFPDRSMVRQARRRGVTLWRVGHATRLIGALFGWHSMRRSLT